MWNLIKYHITVSSETQIAHWYECKYCTWFPQTTSVVLINSKINIKSINHNHHIRGAWVDLIVDKKPTSVPHIILSLAWGAVRRLRAERDKDVNPGGDLHYSTEIHATIYDICSPELSVTPVDSGGVRFLPCLSPAVGRVQGRCLLYEERSQVAFTRREMIPIHIYDLLVDSGLLWGPVCRGWLVEERMVLDLIHTYTSIPLPRLNQ